MVLHDVCAASLRTWRARGTPPAAPFELEGFRHELSIFLTPMLIKILYYLLPFMKRPFHRRRRETYWVKARHQGNPHKPS